jgi:hypothetical protein
MAMIVIPGSLIVTAMDTWGLAFEECTDMLKDLDAAFDAKDFIEAAVGNPNFTRARIERCLASATCKKAWPRA